MPKYRCQRCEIKSEILFPKVLEDRIYYVCEDCFSELYNIHELKRLPKGDRSVSRKEETWYECAIYTSYTVIKSIVFSDGVNTWVSVTTEES